ncbi:hypothetical protein [Streptomyces malaysiensis]|uniref:hypothetical protein n=1 Tax=Streptomyces malaysiensis TaxID=92644 RepID=UPI0036B69DA1
MLDQNVLFNGERYVVWDVYGVDAITGETLYTLRALDGSGSTYGIGAGDWQPVMDGYGSRYRPDGGRAMVACPLDLI